jgi:hypothetical protein
MRYRVAAPIQLALLLLSCTDHEVPPSPAIAYVTGFVTADSGTVEGATVVVDAGGFALGCPALGGGTIGQAQASATGAYTATALLAAQADSVCVTVYATPPTGSTLRQSASLILLVSFRHSPPFDTTHADLHLVPPL